MRKAGFRVLNGCLTSNTLRINELEQQQSANIDRIRQLECKNHIWSLRVIHWPESLEDLGATFECLECKKRIQLQHEEFTVGQCKLLEYAGFEFPKKDELKGVC